MQLATGCVVIYGVTLMWMTCEILGGPSSPPPSHPPTGSSNGTKPPRPSSPPPMGSGNGTTDDGMDGGHRCEKMHHRMPCFSHCRIGCERDECGKQKDHGGRCCPRITCNETDVFVGMDCCPRCCDTNVSLCNQPPPYHCEIGKRGGFQIKCNRMGHCFEEDVMDSENDQVDDTRGFCGNTTIDFLKEINSTMSLFSSAMTEIKFNSEFLKLSGMNQRALIMVDSTMSDPKCEGVLMCAVTEFGHHFQKIEEMFGAIGLVGFDTALARTIVIAKHFLPNYGLCFAQNKPRECTEKARKVNIYELKDNITMCSNVTDFDRKLDRMPREISDFNNEGSEMKPDTFQKMGCNELADPCMSKLMFKLDDRVNEKCGGQKRQVSGPAYFERTKQCMNGGGATIDKANLLKACPCGCYTPDFVNNMPTAKLEEAFQDPETKNAMTRCSDDMRSTLRDKMPLNPHSLDKYGISDKLELFDDSDFDQIQQSTCADLNGDPTAFENTMKAAKAGGKNKCSKLLNHCMPQLNFTIGDPKLRKLGGCAGALSKAAFEQLSDADILQMADDLEAGDFESDEERSEKRQFLGKTFKNMRNRSEKVNATNYQKLSKLIWSVDPEDLDGVIDPAIYSNDTIFKEFKNSIDEDSANAYHIMEKFPMTPARFKEYGKKLKTVGMKKVKDMEADVRNGNLNYDDLASACEFNDDESIGFALLDMALLAQPLDNDFTVEMIKPKLLRYASPRDFVNMTGTMASEICASLSTIINDTDPGAIRYLVKEVKKTYKDNTKNLPLSAMKKIAAGCSQFTEAEYNSLSKENKLECISQLRTQGSKMDKMLSVKQCQIFIREQKMHTDLSAVGGSNDTDISGATQMNYSHVPEFCACGLSKEDVTKAKDNATMNKLVTKLELCPPDLERDKEVTKKLCTFNNGVIELDKLKRFAAHSNQTTECTASTLNSTKVKNAKAAVMQSFTDQKKAQEERVKKGNQEDATNQKASQTDSEIKQTAEYLLNIETQTSSRRKKRATSPLTCANLQGMQTGIVAITDSEIRTMSNTEFKTCYIYMGQQDVAWGTTKCTELRTQMVTGYGAASTWTSTTLEALGCLAQCLSTSDVASLTYSSITEIINIGKCVNIDIAKRQELFARYVTQKLSNNVASMSAADIQSLGSMTCAPTAAQVGSLSAANVLSAVNEIGSSKGSCPDSIKTAYVERLKQSTLGTNVALWSGSYVGSLKQVIDGLTDTDIKSLTTDQVAKITPEAVTMMSATKFASFTVAQLTAMSSSQKSGVTSTQIAALSADQQSAVGGGSTTSGNSIYACHVTVIILAMISLVTQNFKYVM